MGNKWKHGVQWIQQHDEIQLDQQLVCPTISMGMECIMTDTDILYTVTLYTVCSTKKNMRIYEALWEWCFDWKHAAFNGQECEKQRIWLHSSDSDTLPTKREPTIAYIDWSGTYMHMWHTYYSVSKNNARPQPGLKEMIKASRVQWCCIYNCNIYIYIY